jgi:uncharacterized membrane protein
MPWLIFPLISSTFYSLSAFFDNYITDTIFKRRLKPGAIMVPCLIISALVMVVIFAINGLDKLLSLGPLAILMILVSGALDSVAYIPYYKALKKEETTSVEVLYQVSPVIALVFGAVFLKESISSVQLVAFLLIMMAAMLIVFGSGGHRKAKWEAKVALLVFTSCTLFVASDIIFIAAAIGQDFLSCIFWLHAGGMAIVTLFVGLFRSWRHSLKLVFKRHGARKMSVILSGQVVYVIGEMAYHFGMLLVPVAIMSVTGYVLQLIITFALGIILTLFWPRFGREKLSKKLVRRRFLATCMVAVGITLIG